MKRLGVVACIVAMLFGAALYYHFADPLAPERTSSSSEKIATPVTEQTRRGTLEMRAALSHRFVSSDSTDTLYGTIDLSADAFQEGSRPPLNLALVLDRSGSMHGDKLHHLKRSARTIVERLGPRDHLSIISYGGTASLEIASQPVRPSNRAAMERAIEGIQDAGGTNIAAGLRAGREQLRIHDTNANLDRVLLLSDGKPTIGLSDRGAFESLVRQMRRHDDVTLTTMGVGLDYNEDLMTSMADVGGGHYYFIDRPEQSASIFRRELRGLTRTVARQASLTLTLGEGVTLRNLHGYPYRRGAEGRIHIALSDFEARETKSIVVALQTDWTREETRRAMSVDLQYEDMIHHKPVQTSLELTSHATRAPEKLAEGTRDDVLARVQQIEVAESLKRAMEVYQSGHRQRAQHVLRDQLQQLERAERRHQLDGTRLEAIQHELTEMQHALETTPSTSSRGQRLIKRNKARGHRLMRDISAAREF